MGNVCIGTLLILRCTFFWLIDLFELTRDLSYPLLGLWWGGSDLKEFWACPAFRYRLQHNMVAKLLLREIKAGKKTFLDLVQYKCFFNNGQRVDPRCVLAPRARAGARLVHSDNRWFRRSHLINPFTSVSCCSQMECSDPCVCKPFLSF